MKITTVQPLLIGSSLIVRVETDAGVIGFGECSAAGSATPIIAAHLHHALIPHVVGRDPFDTESLVETMFLKNYKIAGQALAMAISGIEVALWDVLGKFLKQPIHKLLGGAYRTSIPVYASSMRRDTTPQQEADKLARAIDECGFGGVKVKIGGRMSFDADASPGRSEAVVREVRTRLGDKIDLMVDGNSSFTPPRAIEMGRRLEQFRLFHFEEPCVYSDLDAHAQVVAALDVPIAGGEQEWEVRRFREMLDRRAFEILQPDVIKVGGFTIMKKIAALCEAHGRVCTPHQTKSLGLIANLHFAAATPCCRYAQEYNVESHPMGAKLFRNPPKVIDGSIQVPQEPGLGVELDERALAGAQPA